jgi:uncharacterized membrane protein YozB (DUF420 family)
MSTSLKPSGWTLAGTLLALGLISSLWAWWVIAPDVITLSNAGMDKHAGHFSLVYLHALGGTIMLFLGLANLYIGTSRRFFQHHKAVGRVYLVGGGIGAISAIFISISAAHNEAAGSVLTNTDISLMSLAGAWLLAAGMAFRAVWNRRYDSHSAWMIRSYVLVWSFVFCRLVSRAPGVEDMGGGDAFIWLSWVGPLLLCEVALQWRAGSRSTRHSSLRGEA